MQSIKSNASQSTVLSKASWEYDPTQAAVDRKEEIVVREQGDSIPYPPSSLLRDGRSAREQETETNVQRNHSAESRATATVFLDEDSNDDDTEEGAGSTAWQDFYSSGCRPSFPLASARTTNCAAIEINFCRLRGTSPHRDLPPSLKKEARSGVETNAALPFGARSRRRRGRVVRVCARGVRHADSCRLRRP